MASVNFDPEDYLDEIRTKDLIAELLRRRDAKRDKFDPKMFGDELSDEIRSEMESDKRAAVLELARDMAVLLKEGRVQEMQWRLEREIIRAELHETPIEQRYVEFMRGRSCQ